MENMNFCEELRSKLTYIPELEKAVVQVTQKSDSRIFIHVYVGKKTKSTQTLIMVDKIQKFLRDLDVSSYIDFRVTFISKSDDDDVIAEYEDILNPRKWNDEWMKTGFVTMNEFEVVPYLNKPGFEVEAFIDGDNYVIRKSIIDFWDSL